MANKELLITEAFEHYFMCRTIEINEENILGVDERVPYFINESIKNYYRKPEISDGKTIYFGRDAIMRFVEICEQEYFSLNDEIELFNGMPLHILLTWRVWTLLCRRKLLLQCLMKYAGDNDKAENFKNVVDILSNVLDSWQKLKIVIETRYKKKKYLLDSGLKGVFLEILNLEDRLIENLQKDFGKYRMGDFYVE